MDKRERERRLAFLDLTEADLRCLRSLRPVLEEHADEFVAIFYRHLLSFEETRRLLVDPQVKTRLLERQREYLIRLTSGTIDDAYVSDRLQIGKTHMRVGLEPRWYLGAYTLYLRLLVKIVLEHHRGDPAVAERTLMAVHKILSFDSQLAMEAYIAGREEQLEFLNRELGEASRSLRRVYDQQADELRQTSARAQAAEELASVATLVAGLAHEIGTPMGVIQGHAELLESSVQDERGRWRLETIREQIDRIASILQTLLNIARPSPPRDFAPVELGLVLEQSLAFLSEKFKSRGVRTELVVDPPATVLGDGEKLQQLFLNLLLNATDAMPEGGDIAVEIAPAEPGRIRISVRDTGQGMPENVRERIFEPFYTTKESGRGSGLGLMVAAGIVRDHGGEIRVDSQPGRGSTFHITLQRAPEGESHRHNM